MPAVKLDSFFDSHDFLLWWYSLKFTATHIRNDPLSLLSEYFISSYNVKSQSLYVKCLLRIYSGFYLLQPNKEIKIFYIIFFNHFNLIFSLDTCLSFRARSGKTLHFFLVSPVLSLSSNNRGMLFKFLMKLQALLPRNWSSQGLPDTNMPRKCW